MWCGGVQILPRSVPELGQYTSVLAAAMLGRAATSSLQPETRKEKMRLSRVASCCSDQAAAIITVLVTLLWKQRDPPLRQS